MSILDRTYARVEATLKGYLRIMPPGQRKPLFAGCPVNVPEIHLDPEQEAIPESVVAYFKKMDEKLNAILILLNRQTVQEDFPIPILVHDISGAGLRFSASRDFTVGAVVEVVVALAMYPLGLTGTVGEIIRRDMVDGQPRWAMKFTEMRESEREKIIQFVVAQQREELRERNLSTPDQSEDQRHA